MKWAVAGLALVASLLAPVAVHAQTVGAKGGLMFATIVHQPDEDYGLSSSADTGFVGGGFVTLLGAKAFSIQVDAVVALRKIDFGVSVQELTSFDVPVVARYRVLTTGAVLLEHAGVLDRHLPPAERHHARPERAVLRVERRQLHAASMGRSLLAGPSN